MAVKHPSEAILQHLKRYRITTAEIVAAVIFEGRVGEARAALSALLSRQKIVSRPLFGKTRFYQLSNAGVREMGEPEEVAKPPGPQALPRLFGVLHFCCNNGHRRRLTRDEYSGNLSSLHQQGLPYLDYVIEQENDSPVLKRIVVDLGGDAERLVRKLADFVKSMADIPDALALLDEDGFSFAVVTTTPSKADAILSAAKKLGLSVTVETIVVEHLANLLPDFYG
jgi:hypothetical protein